MFYKVCIIEYVSQSISLTHVLHNYYVLSTLCTLYFREYLEQNYMHTGCLSLTIKLIRLHGKDYSELSMYEN